MQYFTFNMVVISQGQGHLLSYFRTMCSSTLAMFLPRLVGITKINLKKSAKMLFFILGKQSANHVAAGLTSMRGFSKVCVRFSPVKGDSSFINRNWLEIDTKWKLVLFEPTARILCGSSSLVLIYTPKEQQNKMRGARFIENNFSSFKGSGLFGV